MAATAVDYARVAFDLIDEFDRLRTADQVMDRLSKVLSNFGYTAFLITGVPEPPQRVEPYFLLNGWPESWAKLYTERDYYRDDPVAAWCRRSINPFEWSEAPYDAERCPRAAEVMNIAGDFGMKHGFLVPVVRGNGFHACVTMAGSCPDFDPRAKRAIHLVSLYAHAKAIAFLGLAERTSRRAALTDREREVLAWTALGKSSWDISIILGISERTVNWFIANAARKLDAVNRTQAVVNAIRVGEIRV
jgi:LuxR family transcriptional regulator, quorum-sensing system regulator BjaR1